MLYATVSQRCRYALRAVFELARRDSAYPVKVQEIAEAQGIPQRFLEVILAEMKHGGFVESRRGNEGGYMLQRSAETLAVGEIIGFMEPARGGKRQERAGREVPGDYVFGKLWNAVDEAVADVYAGATFAAMVEEEASKRGGYVPDYAI
jgi:Rrf2 family protein